jgi:multidrug efflux pump subunit AcrB
MFQAVIHRGTLIAVAVLIVAVLGVVAAMRIPVQMIPDLEVRTISIRTAWPGATPQDVEKEIIIEQEEYLRSVPGLERIISSSSFGQASIELEFPFGIDLNQTLIEINNALSQVPSYPENVDEPRIFAASFSSNSFMYFRVMPLEGNPRNLDMVMMQDYVDDHVRVRMETVPGVSMVNVYGGAERQIQILLDPAKLAERDITIAQVRDAIRARNRDVSGGELESGKRRYLLRTIGRFTDLDDMRALILDRRGDAIIRLGDVATLQLDHYKLSRLSYTDGMPVIGLSVRRQPGSNVIDIKDGMLEQMAGINREILGPAGMQMRLVADDATYVQSSVRNVWTNLTLGALLACAVMYLFLRSGRATLVGVMGIPLCTIAAFIGLLVTGRTINVISLAGIAFAIGMTLDNSIVVLESIEHERRRGMDRLKAAITGVQKVWPAVLASTLTTVMVFLPILFIKEEAGQLYSDIAIAISASILASMLVAITVIPAAAARLDLGDSQRSVTQRARDFRQWVLDSVGRRIGNPGQRARVIAVTLIVSLGIYLILTPPGEYLPEGEEPKTFASLSSPPGYNLEIMSRIGFELQEYFLPFLDHSPEQYDRGETEVPAMKYLNLSIQPSGIRIISEPKKPSHIKPLMEAIDAKYREYPAMRPFVTRGSIITSNSGGTRSVNLDISGPDLASVYRVANKAYQRAGEIFDSPPRLRADPSTLSLSQPLVEIRPKWERATEVGMTTQELGYTVSALTDGAFVSEFFLDDDKIDMYLYSKDGVNATLDSLDQKQIYTPVGAILPFSAIAEIVETVDTNNIRRLNGRRTVTLNIIPPDDVALESGVQRVREDLVQYLRDAGDVPSSISMTISGASDELDATREALTANYIVAVVIIYLLLVAIFTHWGYPLLIMTTIPLGVSGGIFGLWLFNFVGSGFPLIGLSELNLSFDMIAMLGFLILMGTVVNNPILIVHQSIVNLREEGMPAREAVANAVETRLRPIAMSTLTTVFGLAPLVFLPGAGTELYRGVGVIVMFGLMGTALVTLTFLPALTVTVLKIVEQWKPPVPSAR